MPTLFTLAKSQGLHSDLDRFACVFLHTSKDGTVDWEAAAADFDLNVKVASFKTVTSKAVGKVLKAAAAGGEGIAAAAGAGSGGGTAKGKGKGTKRKTPASDGEVNGNDEGDGETGAVAKKRAKVGGDNPSAKGKGGGGRETKEVGSFTAINGGDEDVEDGNGETAVKEEGVAD